MDSSMGRGIYDVIMGGVVDLRCMWGGWYDIALSSVMLLL